MPSRLLTLLDDEDAVAAFDPDSISGLTWWLKADALSLSDSDPVTTWTASKGASPTQATASKKGTYKANIVNGKPVVRYDGVDDHHATGSVVQTTQVATIFVVGVPQDASESGLAVKVGGDVGVNTGYGLGVGLNSADADGNEIIGAVEGVAWVDVNSTWGTGTFRVVTAKIAAGGGWTIYRDGVSVGTAAPTAPNAPTANTFVGGYGDGSGFPRFWGGDIAEVLVYNAALSDANRAAVEDYLGDKYGLF